MLGRDETIADAEDRNDVSSRDSSKEPVRAEFARHYASIMRSRAENFKSEPAWPNPAERRSESTVANRDVEPPRVDVGDADNAADHAVRPRSIRRDVRVLHGQCRVEP